MHFPAFYILSLLTKTVSNNIYRAIMHLVEGMVASWLVCSTLEGALWVRALARDIVLCSLARLSTLRVLLSTQVYKWVTANLQLGGNLAMA